jgi:uncharacterized damage-inducible protein DinB
MTFRLDEATEILARTPATLRALLTGLSEPWLEADEGPGTWSPTMVVGHLAQTEERVWVGRVEFLLAHGRAQPLPPVDRAGEGLPAGPAIELVDRFAALRAENLARLRALGLTAADLDREGLHGELGPVRLRQLLATWVAHDLNHLGQIAKTLARRYGEAVGPWTAYLDILHDGPAASP